MMLGNTVVDRNGVRFLFERPTPIHESVQGDILVPLGTTIKRVETPGTMGAMLDPGNLSQVTGFDGLARHSYDPALDVSFPFTFERNSVLLVGVESETQPGHMGRTATLTGWDETVLQDTLYPFRPAYSGPRTTDTLRCLADINTDIFASEIVTRGAPDIDALIKWFGNPWIWNNPNWWNKYLRPREDMPWYGRDAAALISEAMVALNLNYPKAKKLALLTRIVQLGIDLKGIYDAGMAPSYADGGVGTAPTKAPLLLNAKLFGEDPFEFNHVHWAENQQTFYVSSEDTAYPPDMEGDPEWGIRHSYKPWMDNPDWKAKYRRCCTATSWGGIALAMRFWGLMGAWNHSPFFDYMDRYMNVQGTQAAITAAPGWMVDMWERYRGE